MNTIKQKILKTDFKKFFRTFIPLALILSLCGAAAAGLSLRPQISEALSYDHMLDGQIHHPGLEGEWKDIFFASDPGMGVKILLLTLTVCFLLLMAVYWFSTAAALYKSAVSRGNERSAVGLSRPCLKSCRSHHIHHYSKLHKAKMSVLRQMAAFRF